MSFLHFTFGFLCGELAMLLPGILLIVSCIAVSAEDHLSSEYWHFYIMLVLYMSFRFLASKFNENVVKLSFNSVCAGIVVTCASHYNN